MLVDAQIFLVLHVNYGTVRGSNIFEKDFRRFKLGVPTRSAWIRFGGVLHGNICVDAVFNYQQGWFCITGGMSGVILYRRTLSGHIRVQNVAQPSYEDAADGWVVDPSSPRSGLYCFVYFLVIDSIWKSCLLISFYFSYCWKQFVICVYNVLVWLPIYLAQQVV